MKSENSLQADILLAAGGTRGVRLFRNQVGSGWVGNNPKFADNVLILENPRRVTFGWGDGSPDLLGFKSVVVMPEMVGQTIGQVVGIEVKRGRGGVISDDQRRFVTMMERHGAKVGFARSVDEAMKILE